MAEITFDQDQIIEDVNGRIMQDLAAAVKQVAKDGVWEDVEEDDGVDPEKILRRTMATYMGGNVPGWFLDALQATSSTPLNFMAGLANTKII